MYWRYTPIKQSTNLFQGFTFKNPRSQTWNPIFSGCSKFKGSICRKKLLLYCCYHSWPPAKLWATERPSNSSAVREGLYCVIAWRACARTKPWLRSYLPSKTNLLHGSTSSKVWGHSPAQAQNVWGSPVPPWSRSSHQDFFNPGRHGYWSSSRAVETQELETLWACLRRKKRLLQSLFFYYDLAKVKGTSRYLGALVLFLYLVQTAWLGLSG